MTEIHLACFRSASGAEVVSVYFPAQRTGRYTKHDFPSLTAGGLSAIINTNKCGDGEKYPRQHWQREPLGGGKGRRERGEYTPEQRAEQTLISVGFAGRARYRACVGKDTQRPYL